VKIEVEDRAFQAALTRLAAGMDDMTDPMNDIGEFFVVTTKRRFGQGVSPGGSPWAANSPVTLARKTDTRPLFGTSGQLNQQIFHEAGPNQVEVGSNRVQAAMMQFGGTKAAFPHLWGNIPARPFIGLSEEDETGLLEIVTEWLDGLAGAP
jgi:phage virion morphogenesis protein